MNRREITMKMKFAGFLLFSTVLVVCSIIAYRAVHDRLHYRRSVLAFHGAPRIEVNQPIHYLGVRVGEVKEVSARDSSVIVVAKLDRDFRVLRGTTMRMGKRGFLGDETLDLLPPAGDGERSYFAVSDTMRIGQSDAKNSSGSVAGTIAGLVSTVGMISKQDEILRRLDTLESLLRNHVSLHEHDARYSPEATVQK